MQEKKDFEWKQLKNYSFGNIVANNIDDKLPVNCREIGNNALEWTVSSAKDRNGVQELTDNDLNTFWQLRHKNAFIFDIYI